MNWPLNTNAFNFWERLKIASFILSPKNRWTQDVQVKEFESSMARYVGCKYSVFVANGSLANSLLSQYTKDTSSNFDSKNIVVLPSTTWQTSCTPWIREGFTPHFIDISLEDFSIDKGKLEKFVSKNHQSIACIFPTSLIGFSPDMDFYKNLSEKYKVRVCFDNCENTFGEFNGKNISSYFTSSTSTYFGHQLQSVEGGFVFTNSRKEYEYFLMQRNHGMTRSLPAYGLSDATYRNNKVNELFDFHSLGNNFRGTDINAYIGLLDFRKIDHHISQRIKLYDFYKSNLDSQKFYLPPNRNKSTDVAFCLPIICKEKNKVKEVLNICRNLDIEYRPIISGFLGFQTCYRKYFKKTDGFENSINLHQNGIYVGLYSSLSENKILKLVKELNKI